MNNPILHLYYSAAVASTAHRPVALGLALVVGVVSAFGPCTPSRLTWLSTVTTRARNPYAYIAAFIAGSVVLYTLFALVGSLVQNLLGALPWLYAIIGAIALWMGVREVWGSAAHDHCHAVPKTSASYGSAFFQGVLFAAMIQPCCTPLVLSIATTVAPQDPVFGALVLAAFGLGHGLPAFAVGPFSAWRERVQARGFGPVISMVLGGIGIAVGGYFIILA